MATIEEQPLTDEEGRAIATLKRLAKKWPKSLWLFSANGSLNVMRKGDDGRPVHRRDTGSVDERYRVCRIDGISNDGGDW